MSSSRQLDQLEAGLNAKSCQSSSASSGLSCTSSDSDHADEAVRSVTSSTSTSSLFGAPRYVKIDPAALSEADQYILAGMVAICFPGESQFSTSRSYRVELNSQVYIVALTHALCRRPPRVIPISTNTSLEVISDKQCSDTPDAMPMYPVVGTLEIETIRRVTYTPEVNVRLCMMDIDLPSMSAADRNAFGGLLSQLREAKGFQVFPSKKTYFTLANPNGSERLRMHFDFKHFMFAYPYKGRHAFEVLGDLVGQGAFVRAYSSNGTLTLQASGQYRFKLRRHIVKHCARDKAKKDADAKEYEMTKRLPHLRAKEPVTIMRGQSLADGSDTYSVERRQSGKALVELLEEEGQANCASITALKRIELSIALLIALRDQVHAYGIIHRDIKPENIIVDLDRLKVGIIDFNLAKRKGAKVKENVGTAYYLPKEALDSKPRDESSDVYSMGVVLAFLWGMRPKDMGITDKDRDRAYRQAMKYIDSPTLHGLFKWMKHELNVDQRAIINDALAAMIKPNAAQRCSIADAVNSLVEVRLQLITCGFDSDHAAEIRMARGIAHQTTMALETAGQALQDGLGPCADGLFACVEQGINRLRDLPKVASEFVRVLGVKALEGSDAHQAVLSKVAAIKASLHGNVRLLRAADKWVKATLKKHHDHEQPLADDMYTVVQLVAQSVERAKRRMIDRRNVGTVTIDDLVKLDKKTARTLRCIRMGMDGVKAELSVDNGQKETTTRRPRSR